MGDLSLPCARGRVGVGAVVRSFCLVEGAHCFSSSPHLAPPSRPSPARGGRSSRFDAFPGCRVRCSWFDAFPILTCPHPGLPPLAGEGARGSGAFPGCWGRSSRFWLFRRFSFSEVNPELMNYLPANQARHRFVGDLSLPCKRGRVGVGATILSACLMSKALHRG